MQRVANNPIWVAGVLAACLLLVAGSGTAQADAPAGIPTVHWVGTVTGASASSPGSSCTAPGYRSLAAAIATARDGDEVRICAGTYRETVIVERPLSLTAVGQVTIAPVAGATGLDLRATGITLEGVRVDASRVTGQGIRIAGASGVTVRDVTVTASGATTVPEQLVGIVNASGVHLEGVGIDGPAMAPAEAQAPYGIRAVDVDGLVIADSTLTGIPHHNIEVLASADVTVERTSISLPTYAEYQAIECPTDCRYPQAVRFTGVDGATVGESTITGGLFGVHFSFVDQPSLRAGVRGTVADNEITESMVGILIGRAGVAEVTGNRITGTRFAIAAGLETGAARSVVVTDNELMGNQAAVAVARSLDRFELHRNVISGNSRPLIAEVTEPTLLDLRHNWWGSSAGIPRAALDLTGSVDVRLTPACRDRECLEFREYRLRLETSGSGSGTATAEPDRDAYAGGSAVTVVALPARGSVFAGWGGDCVGDALEAIVVMNSDRTCVATFEPFDASNLTVDLGGEVEVPVVPGHPVEAAVGGADGRVRVAAPAAALGDAVRLSAAIVTSVEELDRQVPLAGARLGGAFLVRAYDDGGAVRTDGFASPLTIALELPGATFPGSPPAGELVTALWTGSRWHELPAAVERGEGGRLHVTLQSQYVGLIGVFHQERRGLITPAPAERGVSLGAWGGGAVSLLPAAQSYWFMDGDDPVSYLPGASAFINARFVERYPGGVVPAGTIVVVLR